MVTLTAMTPPRRTRPPRSWSCIYAEVRDPPWQWGGEPRGLPLCAPPTRSGGAFRRGSPVAPPSGSLSSADWRGRLCCCSGEEKLTRPLPEVAVMSPRENSRSGVEWIWAARQLTLNQRVQGSSPCAPTTAFFGPLKSLRKSRLFVSLPEKFVARSFPMLPSSRLIAGS
jgi:hypothetical protein